MKLKLSLGHFPARFVRDRGGGQGSKSKRKPKMAQKLYSKTTNMFYSCYSKPVSRHKQIVRQNLKGDANSKGKLYS